MGVQGSRCKGPEARVGSWVQRSARGLLVGGWVEERRGARRGRRADHSVSCGQRRTLAFALSERKSCLEALGQCVSWPPALSMA